MKQALDEASVVNLPMEQDGELNAKQGLEEASVEKLPVEQPGAAI